MSDNTRQRLRDLIALLRNHPAGLGAAEMAEMLNVTRQTIYKDIDRLSFDGIPIYEENHRFYLDAQYLNEIQLSLAQTWFMYLPLRRIVRADLHRYPLVRSLLHQVAVLFDPELADQLVPDTTEIDETAADPIFRDLVYCWHKQRHVELRYLRPNADRPSKLVVAPWWFEPAVWSDAFYLICGLKKPDGSHEPLTLKLDRIQSVQILDLPFERPIGREITTRLEETWGIWVGEEEPVQVTLRFHNRQYQRLKETRWHPTERVSLDQEGSVIWQAHVSEPHEMLPWIRGWGADVEVLAPDYIREQIASEAETTARLYGKGLSQGAERYF